MSDRDWDDDELDYEDYEDDDDEEEYEDPHEAAMLQAFEAFSQDLSAEVERTQNKLGRRLTMAEKEAVAFQGIEQAARGQDFNVEASLEDHYRALGTAPPDMDTHSGRTAYMQQRLEETNSTPIVDEDREYDLDNAKDRADYMHARMQGAEFEDAETDDGW